MIKARNAKKIALKIFFLKNNCSGCAGFRRNNRKINSEIVIKIICGPNPTLPKASGVNTIKKIMHISIRLSKEMAPILYLRSRSDIFMISFCINGFALMNIAIACQRKLRYRWARRLR